VGSRDLGLLNEQNFICRWYSTDQKKEPKLKSKCALSEKTSKIQTEKCCHDDRKGERYRSIIVIRWEIRQEDNAENGNDGLEVEQV
jgi:hypothetical protein